MGPLLALLCGAAPAMEPPEQHRLVFEVAVPPHSVYTSFVIELDRLGDHRQLTLTDDGSHNLDRPYDGTYVASDEDAWSRYVEVTLVGIPLEGGEEVLFSGLVRTEDVRSSTIGWQVVQLAEEDPFTARRVAVARPGGAASMAEGLPMLVAFGWGLLLLVFVGTLSRGRK